MVKQRTACRPSRPESVYHTWRKYPSCRHSLCVGVYVCARGRGGKGECGCVCVCARERGGKGECVYVCARGRGGKGEEIFFGSGHTVGTLILHPSNSAWKNQLFMISNSMSNTGVLVSVPGIIRDSTSTSEYGHHIHQGQLTEN